MDSGDRIALAAKIEIVANECPKYAEEKLKLPYFTMGVCTGVTIYRKIFDELNWFEMLKESLSNLRPDEI